MNCLVRVHLELNRFKDELEDELKGRCCFIHQYR